MLIKLKSQRTEFENQSDSNSIKLKPRITDQQREDHLTHYYTLGINKRNGTELVTSNCLITPIVIELKQANNEQSSCCQQIDHQEV